MQVSRRGVLIRAVQGLGVLALASPVWAEDRRAVLRPGPVSVRIGGQEIDMLG